MDGSIMTRASLPKYAIKNLPKAFWRVQSATENFLEKGENPSAFKPASANVEFDKKRRTHEHIKLNGSICSDRSGIHSHLEFPLKVKRSSN
jgi:hypothetical protein